MPTLELTAENLDSTIRNNDIVIIDFWADWCAPCKQFGPVFEASSDQNPDIAHMKCDTQKQQEIATQFGIRSIPTVAIFREQIMLFMQAGAFPDSALQELITQVRDLDMEEVRKKIAAEEAAADAKA